MTRSKVNTTVSKIVLALAIILVLGAIPQLNITVASAEENKRTKIVMLIGSEGFMAPLSDAYGKLGDFPVDLELYNSNDLKDEGKTERLYNSIREADLFLLEMIGGTGVLALEPLLQELVDSDWPGTAISTRSTPFPEKLRVLDDSTGTLAKYFDNGGEENMRRMVLYLATTYGTISSGTVVTDEPLGPVVMLGRFIYHPDTVMSPTEGIYNTLDEYLAWYEGSGHYRDGAPWVGIITYDSSYKNSDYEMYTAMLNELENKGANVLLVFSDSDNRATVLHDFFMPDGKRQIDFLIAGVGFNYIFGLPEEGVNLFKQLNVPVMSPVYSSDLAEWEGSLAGITSEIPWQIAFPELDGRIEPVFIGGSTLQDIDENTGAELAKKMPLPERIERATERALAWVNLQQKRNADKRVALVYYNHHGGKDDIGASYLNSMASASVILEAMRDEGYTITGDLDTPAMESFMHGLGRNIGSWAPGELEAIVREGALLLPLEKYMAWYDQIPNELRYELEREWGPPPGDMMVYEGNLVIPGAIKGNVFVGPQPMRGWGEDPTKIAHSPTLPPPHQYIAFYFWLQHEFKADAVIHLGTHGTLEWLPGRSIGLGEDDWPDLLMGNLPDIYPYIVNNPGEGTQAKRRGYAVTIDHLTPPMIEPGLYGALDELQQLITDYWSSTDKGNPERAVHLRGQIIEKVRENNLDQDLGIDLDKDDFQEAALFLHEYLEDLAVELMPYGLHTFGVPPEGEMLDLMVNSIVNYNVSARGGSQGELKQKLLLTTDEIKNLLRVLKGEYLEPGLAKDPVRVPDILPTGKNLVTFDPRMVPDEAAWHVGKKAADELLEKYHAEHGHYPETVGVVLWAIETMRTDGESIGLILRLMGAEPVWDESGRVSSVEVTPLEELKRPRVNVLVTISGLFRDTFGHTIEVLDEAFRQMAVLEEEADSNYVRKTYKHLREQLQEQGMSPEESDTLARSRIFGDPPGAYGTGVSDLGSSTSAWENSDELADTYMSRMSYAYGKNAYGVPARSTFQEILKSVDAITQVKDSLWGALDNDDVAQYFGGLNLAARMASGEEISQYIVNTRSGDAKVQTFKEFVGMELRSRLLNPKWIDGMAEEGYAGYREIGDHVANMFLVDATLGGLGDWSWDQVAETYILDDQMMKMMDPFVAQSIIGWNMEAARRDMWKTDRETLTQLANNYVETAARYGVVCCHHTCNNIVFNEWVASYATVDVGTVNKFADVFYNATNHRLMEGQEITPSEAGRDPNNLSSDKHSPSLMADNRAKTRLRAQHIEDGDREQSVGVGDETDQGEKKPRAFELVEEDTGEQSATGTKAVSIIAIVVALGLMALFFRGYMRKQS